MNKTTEEKLDFEEMKWRKITFITALLALVSLVLTYVFLSPNVMAPLASIWMILFCFNFGVTIGIMYAHKILQKKRKMKIPEIFYSAQGEGQ